MNDGFERISKEVTVTYLRFVPSNKIRVKNELECVWKEAAVGFDMIWKEPYSLHLLLGKFIVLSFT